MKSIFIFATLLFCLVAYAPLTSAQIDDQYGYSSTRDEFSNGYQAGYDHGMQDRHAGLNFDYEHSDMYQYGSADFQSGYEQGYNEGFYGNHSTRSYTNHSTRSYTNHPGAVEVFSATGFRGNVMRLGIGRYDSIDLEDVESLQINADVRVILFNEPDFEGRTVILTADAPNLRDMQKRGFMPFGFMRHHRGSMIVEPLR